MATGANSSNSALTLSPGMTISVPAGSVTHPAQPSTQLQLIHVHFHCLIDTNTCTEGSERIEVRLSDTAQWLSVAGIRLRLHEAPHDLACRGCMDWRSKVSVSLA